jgi:hypothetical protein
MFDRYEIPGEPVWRQMTELQSRKEVIEGWLASSVVPAHLVAVLQEMLAATELQLKLLRNQDSDSSSPLREAG